MDIGGKYDQLYCRSATMFARDNLELGFLLIGVQNMNSKHTKKLKEV